jgi:hypothetical protein
MTVRVKPSTPRVAFLSELSPDDVRERMRAFADSYKDDWQQWMDVARSAPIDSPVSAEKFRNVLRGWQAVRSKTKGRVVRQCHAAVVQGELCMEQLLTEAPFSLTGEIDTTRREREWISSIRIWRTCEIPSRCAKMTSPMSDDQAPTKPDPSKPPRV